MKEVVEFDNSFLLVYQQYYKDVEVLNAELKIKVTPEGQITWINSHCYQDIQISEKPNISLADAKNIALSRYDVQSNESKENGKLVIFRDHETDNLSLCWNLMLINKEKNLNKILLINANTGEIILEYDSFINEDVNGNVKIKSWDLPGMEGGSPDITPNCQDLKVTVTGVGSNNTDQNGNYSVTVPSSGNYTVTSSLDGPHAYVYNYTGAEASYTGNASTSSDHNWIWQDASHYNEYFVFSYMNNAWHEFSSDVPGFSNNYWNTNKMLGYANYGSGVNGSANGTYMTITPDNHYGCSVYHEYSHNVNNRARGGWIGWPYAYSDGYAMDEGFADYFSCTFRNDPHRYASDRDLGTKMKYYSPGPPNDSEHEGHTRGQIIGGACWDLRNKSGMDVNYVNGKVYQTISGLNYLDTFSDFFDDILTTDDDDDNIFNGTPHDNQICDAFVNDHKIIGSYLAGDINLSINISSTVDLIDAVNINSTSFLIILSSGTIDLNGNFIKFNGDGNFLNQGNITPNNIIVKSGSTIKGYYSKIEQAVSNAVSGQVIYISSGTHDISENITVPSEVTLSIQSGATINLGTYKITTTSGIITVSDGATISPDVRRKSGSTILGLYPSISSALTAASSGQTVEYGGSHSFLSSNLTISSGITLSAKAGSTLSFGSGYYLSVSGTLNASGTSASRATFTRSGTSGTWGGIRYYSGSSGSLQYANISNAYYGVYFSGSSATISNSIISSCTYGLYASSCSPTITNVNISGCTYGVRPYYSSLSLTNSTISSCSYGVYSYYNSPTMSNNTISSCTYGVYLNHAESAVVNTNEITGCTRGIYGYYSGLSDFTDNYITSGGTSRVAGIQVYNATEPTVYNNTTEGSFTYGLDADHYSRPLAIGSGGQNYQGYNRIIGGGEI